MDSSIQISISRNQSTEINNNQAFDPSAAAEFEQLMATPNQMGTGTQTMTASAARETTASPASISPTAAKYAKAFGGADGFGGDGHDRAKLQAAGLTYDSNGPTSIQDVLNSAGNSNQFHISQDGQAQTQRVFALAEAEGMTQDGYLSANELTRLQSIIENPSLGSTPQSQALARAIAADATQSNTWTGSPETGGSSSSAPAQSAAGAAGAEAFNFEDWLMMMMGWNLQEMQKQWETQEGRAQIIDAVKTKLEDTGMDSATVDSTMEEFSGMMDSGDVQGAVSLIEGAVSTPL